MPSGDAHDVRPPSASLFCDSSVGVELMNPKNISLEEYTEYITSTVGFMEMWQHCYYA
jgi:hypothetical protein